MNDFRDRELKVGDKVALMVDKAFEMHYGKTRSQLTEGEVVGFTTKMVRIKIKDRVAVRMPYHLAQLG